MLVAGCWLLVAGRWLLVAGCWFLVAGCWLLVAGCWLLAARRRPPVAANGYRAVNQQPVTSNQQPPTGPGHTYCFRCPHDPGPALPTPARRDHRPLHTVRPGRFRQAAGV